MSDQAIPHREVADHGGDVDRSPDPVARHVIAEPDLVRRSATEVAFPWVWALVGLVIVIVAVVIALVTESQGIGLG